MVRIARARPTEYLVTSRKGLLSNIGLGGRAWLWPGTDYVTVPAVKQECDFAMTQESQDGIPLRFKGIAVFSISEPVRAAACFDFADTAGLDQLRTLISHICLGELRDRVSHMTMSACIEERKTTLSAAVEQALRSVAEQTDDGWGVRIDLVQIAQVFIVDDELRGRLEAQLRDAVEAKSERSHIDKEEAVQKARIDKEEAVQKARIASERRLAEDKAAAQEDQQRSIEVEIAVRRLANELRALEVEAEMLDKEAEAALERDMLPLRQVPEIARALAGMFQGADLSIYGSESEILRSAQPLLDLLGKQLRGD